MEWEANPPPSPADRAYFKNFARRCPKCDRKFDPANPKTFLPRPFPGKFKIIFHIIATTLVCIALAFIVAFFQLAAASGH
jgi:hypothetical protein